MLLLTATGTWAQTPGIPLAPGNCRYSDPDFELGKAGETTVISGGRTFPVGDYHVAGDLYFTEGTYTIQPGTTFYVEGTARTKPGTPPAVLSSRLIIGKNATINATQANFTAACPSSMWYGFYFAEETVRQVLYLTDCNIAHAFNAVFAPPLALDCHYLVTDCTFYNDFRHITDESKYSAPVFNRIKDNEFICRPPLLAPFSTINGQEYWTYEAVRLTPYGVQNQVVAYDANYTEGAIYGLVCNVPGQAKVAIQ